MKKFIIMLICMMSLLACKEVTVVDVYPSSYDEDKIILVFDDGAQKTVSVGDSLYCAKVGDSLSKILGDVSLKDRSAAMIKITDKNVQGNDIAYTFDNCDVVIITGNEFFYYDRFGRLNRTRELSTDEMRTWYNCEVGQTGRLTFWWYLPIDMDKLPDYSMERIVTKINRYNGHYASIDGSISLRGGILVSTSGDGRIYGESAGGENFFINLYFEDGPPVSVNAKDNPLWLDIVPGSKVLESRRQGKKYYTPLL